MNLLVYGPGRLGTAVVEAATQLGWTTTVVGRPAHGMRRDAPAADVVVDASQGDAVVGNLEHALEAGNRHFVVAATGWHGEEDTVRRCLLDADASAVVAENLSLAAGVFVRLAEVAAAWYAAAGAFEPSIVEWHRAGKLDRPSGTARAIARRVALADPRWEGPDARADDAGTRPRFDVFGVRAGCNPGTHLVTFDGPAESIELRLTARDRTAYADGALAAAWWLLAEPREPGMHSFNAVVDALLTTGRPTPALA